MKQPGQSQQRHEFERERSRRLDAVYRHALAENQALTARNREFYQAVGAFAQDLPTDGETRRLLEEHVGVGPQAQMPPESTAAVRPAWNGQERRRS